MISIVHSISIFLPLTMDVNGDQHLFGYQHSSNSTEEKKTLTGLEQLEGEALFTLVRFRFKTASYNKTIPVYTGVSAAFQKRSPFTLHNRKRMSRDHSCRYNHRIVKVDSLLFRWRMHLRAWSGRMGNHTYLWVQQWAWCYCLHGVKDTQRECGQPRHRFQKSPFWYVYTETQPLSFHTKTGSAVFKSLGFRPRKHRSSVNDRRNRSKSYAF